MPDLADFLLHRIAEDETVAVQLAELWAKVTDSDRGRLDPGVREGMDSVFAVADGAPADGAPNRLLAECYAKRRIVEHMRYEVDPGQGRGAGRPLPGHTVLRLLALPYAGHPDYREEWQP
ncbi:DUF6221 family protein [Geodermatophilus sp. SYSU D00079]